MAKMNMIQALNSAMDIAMDRDPHVIVMGEDVGYFGGVFRCTDGLQRKYGEHRCIDTPIAEGGIIGTAIGDRCVDAAVFAVLALQAVGAAEYAAEVADVLAHDNHVRV
ncbi:MAG: alpha-ketoacid dehydrogenase subunit beta, partial [Pseudomonadota bacterium]